MRPSDSVALEFVDRRSTNSSMLARQLQDRAMGRQPPGELARRERTRRTYAVDVSTAKTVPVSERGSVER